MPARGVMLVHPMSSTYGFFVASERPKVGRKTKRISQGLGEAQRLFGIPTGDLTLGLSEALKIYATYSTNVVPLRGPFINNIALFYMRQFSLRPTRLKSRTCSFARTEERVACRPQSTFFNLSFTGVMPGQPSELLKVSAHTSG